MAAFFYQRADGAVVQSDVYQTYNPPGFTYMGRLDAAPGPVVGTIATDGGAIQEWSASAVGTTGAPADPFAALDFVSRVDPLPQGGQFRTDDPPQYFTSGTGDGIVGPPVSSAMSDAFWVGGLLLALFLLMRRGRS